MELNVKCEAVWKVSNQKRLELYLLDNIVDTVPVYQLSWRFNSNPNADLKTQIPNSKKEWDADWQNTKTADCWKRSWKTLFLPAAETSAAPDGGFGFPRGTTVESSKEGRSSSTSPDVPSDQRTGKPPAVTQVDPSHLRWIAYLRMRQITDHIGILSAPHELRANFDPGTNPKQFNGTKF